jgi:hypothetical protein
LIPRNVEIVGSYCFSSCKSLSSITFESNSHLTRIESEAFSSSSLQSILILSTILFLICWVIGITIIGCPKSPDRPPISINIRNIKDIFVLSDKRSLVHRNTKTKTKTYSSHVLIIVNLSGVSPRYGHGQ